MSRIYYLDPQRRPKLKDKDHPTQSSPPGILPYSPGTHNPVKPSLKRVPLGPGSDKKIP